MTTREKAERGKRAAALFLGLDIDRRNGALASIAAALRRGSASIAAANAEDLAGARAELLPPPLLKRLRFDEDKLEESVLGIEALRGLRDPLGRLLSARRLDEGLELRQVSCPIGLVAMIFE
jgi:glutamate-5-semialdehyde dehydrogenase